MLVTLAPLGILIAPLGGAWLSRRALKPIDEMTVAARQIGISNLAERLATPQTGDELQRLAETWNLMLTRLESAVGRLSRFTSDASHELRTPLAIIRATAEIANRKPRSVEVYRSALSSVVQESERMTGLIEDLLFLARSDSNQLELPLENVALQDVLENACKLMKPIAEKHLVQLNQSYRSRPGMITANKAAIRRLFLILIDNAIKYSRPDGQVSIATSDDGHQISVSVRDEGMGIRESDLSFIFDRFYRGQNAREAGHDGVGLGLALASSIAEQHKSRIDIKSEIAVGSEFSIKFDLDLLPNSQIADKTIDRQSFV